MTGICIHCPECAGEKTTGTWCLRHGCEMSVIEDGYTPYLGRPASYRCDSCGKQLHRLTIPTDGATGGSDG